MKKFLFAALAFAGLAACSSDSEINTMIAPEQPKDFVLHATIAAADDSRVLVSGEHYTHPEWEQGDLISLRSASGSAVELTAESDGNPVRFVGTLGSVAEVDNFYAVYPKMEIDDAQTISVNYAAQNGTSQQAVLLVGKAEQVSRDKVSMAFTPVNALLHVNLTDAPAALETVELRQISGEDFPTAFTYHIDSETVTVTVTNSASAIKITPSDTSFFIALPADLELGNYELIFTTTDGGFFARGYAGKTFVKGTTTTIDLKWETPTVTLGAKTSYSYYDTNDNTQKKLANKCDNSTIYFDMGPDNNSCRSSYAGVQNAMITDCGFVVDGTTYNTANGVTWDKENKTFYMANQSGMSWAAHKVEAFIKTKHNVYIASSADLHVTGLPYEGVPPQKEDGWSTSGNVAWVDNYIYLGARVGTWNSKGGTITINFYIPSNIDIVAYNKAYIQSNSVKTTYKFLVSNTALCSVTPERSSNSTYDKASDAVILSESPTVVCESSYGNVWGTHSEVYAVKISYKE